jgi:hypothetical protein
MRERGKAMGAEFAGKGVNIALGPAMNMGRLPQGITHKILDHTTSTHSHITDRW